MTRQEEIEQAAQRLAETKRTNDAKQQCLYDFEIAAQWADSHPHWIPVEEELPTGQPDENGRTPNYLCFCTGGAYRMANFKDGVWWDCDEDDDDENSVEWYVVYDITHWMPLPAPPATKGGVS